MDKRFFGTDGIRGRVGTSPIDAAFMLRLGYAVGKVLDCSGRKVLIGKDTRISGYMLEAALQAGLSSAGVHIHLLGPLPTPAVAYLTSTFRARAGIVISASHNPFYDNGVKFFTADGKKLSDATERAIEQALQQSLETVPSHDLGKAHRVHDAAGRYIEFCKSTMHPGRDFSGLKVVVDCANGATYNVAPHVFSELGAAVVAIGVRPDGTNINDSGAMNPRQLLKEVVRHGADLGVGFDGDGDRAVMVDDRGGLLDGDDILFVLAKARLLRGETFGGVVGTKMSNLGLEEALAELGVPFSRAEIGENFVEAELEQRGWQLGGESSGHVICREKTSTGDGVISALQVVEAVISCRMPLSELRRGMSKYPQASVSVEVPPEIDITQAHRVQQVLESVQARLKGRGRALLRRSGTEPVVRVVVESRDQHDIKHYIAAISGEVRRVAASQL